MDKNKKWGRFKVSWRFQINFYIITLSTRERLRNAIECDIAIVEEFCLFKLMKGLGETKAFWEIYATIIFDRF